MDVIFTVIAAVAALVMLVAVIAGGITGIITERKYIEREIKKFEQTNPTKENHAHRNH